MPGFRASCGRRSTDAVGASHVDTHVHKVAEDFEQSPWTPSQWSSAKGQTSLVSEPAPDVRTAKSLKLDVAFSGNGFEHFTAEPVTPLWIPGNAQSVTLRCKVSDSHYGLKMNFSDGWGRDRVNGEYLAWDIRTDPSGGWKTATFKVPESWVRPVRINGVSTHNWEARNAKRTIHIQVDDIEVETDIHRRRSEDRRADDLDAGTPPGQAGRGPEAVSPHAAGGGRYVERAGVERLHPRASRRCGFA